MFFEKAPSSTMLTALGPAVLAGIAVVSLLGVGGCRRFAKPVAVGDASFIVECIDLVKCHREAAKLCPGGFRTVAIAGREYKETFTERGAVKQMQVDCTQGEAAASAGAPEGPPPTGAAGFVFAASVDETADACRSAGHDWTAGDRTARCGGLASNLNLDAYATFELCEEKVCSIRLIVPPGASDDMRWHARMVSLRERLTKKYGEPKADDEDLRAACGTYPKDCTGLPNLRAKYEWLWSSGQEITLEVVSDLPRGPLVTLTYAAPARTNTTRAEGL